MNETKKSPNTRKFFLRSTTAVSLNERFTGVLMDQQTQPRAVTVDCLLQQRREVIEPSQVVLVKRKPLSLHLKTHAPLVRVRQCMRRSVWSRLGWMQLSRSLPRGFWSFRNKYRRRATFKCFCRDGAKYPGRLGLRQPRMKANVQKLTAGQTQPSVHLNKGETTTSKGWGWNRKGVLPNRKQLDDQLDEYMSLSKRRLDAQLDEYMAMAGQTDVTWDLGGQEHEALYD